MFRHITRREDARVAGPAEFINDDAVVDRQAGGRPERGIGDYADADCDDIRLDRAPVGGIDRATAVCGADPVDGAVQRISTPLR